MDQTGDHGRVLHLRKVSRAVQLDESAGRKALGKLSASLFEEGHVEIATCHQGRYPNSIDSTPGVQSAGPGLLGDIVAEDDLVHLESKRSNWLSNSAFWLPWSVQPQPGLQTVDLLEAPSLDGIVEQFVDSGGLRVQLELGAATYCRGNQHKASHQLRSRERCIECQSTPHGTAHQPCGFVSYDFKQGKQVIDMREGCRREGGLSEPPSVIRHRRHGLDELSDDLVPAPAIRHSRVEKHCRGTRSAPPLSHESDSIHAHS